MWRWWNEEYLNKYCQTLFIYVRHVYNEWSAYYVSDQIGKKA